MANLQPARGTHDLIFDDARKHRYIVDLALSSSKKYGFEEIATPIFEPTAVFARTLGEASDIVSKEMYTFEDRGGDSLTLRPEGTAGVVRAVISEGLFHKLPLKFFYAGPMFRYERPQKGRQRQFHQIGIEALGLPTPLADAESIACGYSVLKSLGVASSCTLKLNSLGDESSRAAFRQALVSYLEKYRNDLSEDSQNRLDKNPLRILDSKSAKDQEIVKNGPKLSQHLSAPAVKFKDELLELLTALGLPFQYDEKLVRGLDYYTHTVFEFVTDKLGAQDAVLAGGRYDGLVELMGGPSTPGVGWAAGIERLSLLLPDSSSIKISRPLVVLPLDEKQISYGLKLAEFVRASSTQPVEVLVGSQLGKRLKKATDRYNSVVALIVGESEVQQNTVQCKFLDSGEQKNLSWNDILKEILTQS